MGLRSESDRKKCESCYYWSPGDDKQRGGTCLRFPPKWYMPGMGWMQPTTKPWNVCGEWVDRLLGPKK